MTNPVSSSENSPPQNVCRRTHLKIAYFILIFLFIVFFAGVSIFGANFIRMQQTMAAQMQNLTTQNQLLQKTLSNQDQQLKDLTSRANQYQAALSRLNQVVENQSTQWVADEVNYLLQTANFLLLYEKNIPVAMALLKTADSYLMHFSTQDFLTWREKINRHLVELQSIHPIDLTGNYLQLKAFDDQINNLPWLENRFRTPTTSSNTQPGAPPVSKWKQIGENWLSTLKTLVIVRHHDQLQTPFTSDSLRQILLVNLHVLFAQAQWALLQQQTIIYQSSLSQIQNLLKQYFLFSDPRVQTLLSGIDSLKTVNLSASLPILDDVLPSDIKMEAALPLTTPIEKASEAKTTETGSKLDLSIDVSPEKPSGITATLPPTQSNKEKSPVAPAIPTNQQGEKA